MATKFIREDWENDGRWVQPPLSGCFWTHWSETESTKAIVPEVNLTPILFLDGNTLVHVGDKRAVKELMVKLYKDGKLRTLYDRLEATGSKCEKAHISLLDQQDLPLAGYLKQLFHTYQELAGMWWLTIMLGDALQAHLLDEGIVESEQEMIGKLAPFHRTTWLEKQSEEVNAFAKCIADKFSDISPDQVNENLIAQNKELLADLEKHIYEFSWFGTHHWMGDEYTLETALAQIRDVMEKDEKSKATKGIKADDKDLWEFLASITYWRTHCAEVTAKVVFRSRGRLTECAEKWEMSYEELRGLSSHEIEAYLDSGSNSIELPTNYDERKQGYGCYVDDNGKERVVTGIEYQEIYDAVVKVDIKEGVEVKGTVASKGEPVTGVVKILIEPKDFAKFEEGDILVAPETTPDFVPYMKKASAIVTDRGGITSHASIVSRELGIPCVIGTTVGTQVLKDGMKVVVNTDDGTVTIQDEE